LRDRKIPIYAKYPFLVQPSEYIAQYFGTEIPVAKLIEVDEFAGRALVRVEANLKNMRYSVTTKEVVEVLSFYIGLMLTASSSRWALKKYIDSEAKRAYLFLKNDDEKLVEFIARKIGLKAEYLGTEVNKCGLAVVVGRDTLSNKDYVECYQYRVTIPSYLVGTEKLSTDPKWKLVNRYVKGGFVYLSKRDVSRLIEEYLKRYLLKVTEDLPRVIGGSKDVLGSTFANLSRRVKEIVKEVGGPSEALEASEEVARGVVLEELFPPCIKDLKNSLLAGEHLSHHQRFALATFLLNIGASVEYVLDLFRHAPDFNERIARYQIEHLAGLRGGRKKYSMYSCDKMKSLGICVSECGVKNPLHYYRLQVKRYLNEKQYSHSQGSQSPQVRRR